MSSWERARYIPWDRIPQEGADLDVEKERIFRQLQRETIKDELIAKLQRKKRSVKGQKEKAFEEKSGTRPQPLIDQIRDAWFGVTSA